MAVMYEFECMAGHEFALWSDTARLCPECGSEFLKRIFLTAPAISTGRAAATDKMIQRELDAQGITNLQTRGEGEQAKVTYKTTQEQLAASKVLEDFPQAKVSESQFASMHKALVNKFQVAGGVKAVIGSGIGKTKEGRMAAGLIRNIRNYPQYKPQTVVTRADTRKVVVNAKRAQVRD